MSHEFNQERRILCVEDGSVRPAPDSRSIWPLPEPPTGLSESSSFELLGTIQNFDSWLEGQGGGSLRHSGESYSNTKLHQALQAIGHVLEHHHSILIEG